MRVRVPSGQPQIEYRFMLRDVFVHVTYRFPYFHILQPLSVAPVIRRCSNPSTDFLEKGAGVLIAFALGPFLSMQLGRCLRAFRLSFPYSHAPLITQAGGHDPRVTADEGPTTLL